MTWIFRDEGDTSNPLLALPYGEKHFTTGLPTWYERVGNRTKFIALVSTGELGGALEVRYAGRTLEEYDALGNRQWVFHPGVQSTGFDDPVQGRPLFFPNLNYTFSNKAYFEVFLPAELSPDEGEEPTRSQFVVTGLKINRYDADGTVVDRAAYGYPALFSSDIWLRRYNLAPSRFDFGSHFEAVAECEELIAWSTGAGLRGEYFATTAFANSVAVRNDALVDFSFSATPPLPELPTSDYSIRWTGKVIARFAQNYTFYLTTTDDEARVVVNGVQVAQTFGGEASGVIALAANVESDITVEYVNTAGFGGQVKLEWSSLSQVRETVPTESLRAGVIMLPRYRCGLSFPQSISAMDAHRSIMAFMPGAGWNDRDSKLRYIPKLSDQALASQLAYLSAESASALTRNLLSFQFYRKKPHEKPNFIRAFYRDESHVDLKERFVEVDREGLREQNNGLLNEIVLPSIGVTSQSLAQRFAETLMRRLSDLDGFAQAKTFFSTGYRATKDCLVAVAHDDLAGTTLADRKSFVVRSQKFEPPGDNITFEFQEHGEFYADNMHGEVNPTKAPGTVTPRFTKPPLVAGVTFSTGERVTGDGSRVRTIIAEVEASDFELRQFIQAYLQRPGEASLSRYGVPVEVDLATLKASFTVDVASSGFHNFKFMSRTIDGVVRDLTEGTLYAYSVAVSSAVPPAPTGLGATLTADGRVLWSWAQPFAADFAFWRIKDALGVVIVNRWDAQSWAQEPTAGSLAIQVVAVNRSGTESTSTGVVVFAMPSPLAPAGFTLTLYGRDLLYSWLAVEGLTYQVSRDGVTPFDAAAAGSYREPLNVPQAVGVLTRYARSLRLGIASAWIAASVPVTAPGAPAGYTVGAVGRRITWRLSPSPASDVSYYRVKTTGGVLIEDQIGLVWSEDGTAGVYTYDRRFYAVSALGVESAVPLAATFTAPQPSAPAGVTVTTSGRLIVWTLAPSPSTTVTSYRMRDSALALLKYDQGLEITETGQYGLASYTRNFYAVDAFGQESAALNKVFQPPAPDVPAGYSLLLIQRYLQHRWSSARSYQPRSLTWQNRVNATAAPSTNALTATSGGDNTSGASSVETIRQGYAEFSLTATIGGGMYGLSQTDINQSYASVQFGIQIYDNVLYIYESSLYRGTYGGGVLAGDRYRVAVEDSVVKYYRVRAGVVSLLYTSGVVPVLPLRVDIAFLTLGETLTATLAEQTIGNTFDVDDAADFLTPLVRDTSAHTFDESTGGIATRAITRYLRAVSALGVPSTAVSATLNNAPPVAPLLTKDAANARPNSVRVGVSAPADPSRIVTTVVQTRAQGGAWPLSTAEGTAGVERYSGAEGTVIFEWLPGGTAEMRVAFEDALTVAISGNNPAIDYQWSATLSHPFDKFGSAQIGQLGDVNFDTTSNLARMIASRAQAEISGGGTMRWSQGQSKGEVPDFVAVGGFNVSGGRYYNTSGATGHQYGAYSVDPYSGTLSLEFTFEGDTSATDVGAWAGFSPNQTINAGTWQTYAFGVFLWKDQNLSEGGTTTPTIWLAAGGVHTQIAGTSFKKGDYFKVERDAGNIFRLYQNGVLIYTHGAALAGAMYAKVHSYYGAVAGGLSSEVDNIVVSATVGTLNAFTWATRFRITIGTQATTGFVDIPANSVTLAANQGLIARFTIATGVVSLIVVDYSTYTPPAATTGVLDFTVAVHNGDNGKLYLFDGRVLDAGQTIRGGAYLPVASIGSAFIQLAAIVAAHIGLLQVKDAHIDTVRANKVIAQLGDFDIIFVNTISSRGFASTGAQTPQTELINWTNLVGGVVKNSNGSLTSSGALWANGADSDRAIFAASGGFLEWTISSITQTMMAGLSYDSALGSYLNIDFAIYTQTSTIYAYENSIGYAIYAGAQVGDTFRVEVSAAGVVTYSVRPLGTTSFTLLRTSPVAARFPLRATCSLYQAGEVLPPLYLNGILAPLNGTRVHARNKINVALDPNDDFYKSGGGSAFWGESGFSSSGEETLAAGQLGGVEFEATATGTNALFCGLSLSDPDQNYTSHAYAVQLYNNTLTCYRNGAQQGIAYATTPGDKIRIARENTTGAISVRQNGVLRVTFDAASTAALLVDVAFYGANAGALLKSLRFFKTGAVGQGWRFDPKGDGEIAGSLVLGGVKMSTVQARSTYSLDERQQYRGRDNDVFLREKVTSAAVIQTTVTELNDVEYILTSSLFLYLVDSYANADSIMRTEVAVLNHFGEEIVAPVIFSTRGDGVVGHGRHTRQYADPALGQAIYKIRYENAYGWSLPKYLRGTTLYDEPPTVLRKDSPLELNVDTYRDQLLAGWFPAVAQTANQTIHWKRVEPSGHPAAVVTEETWNLGGGSGATLLYRLYGVAVFASDTYYDLWVTHDLATPVVSNVVRVKTESYYDPQVTQPVVGMFAVGINPTNKQPLLDYDWRVSGTPSGVPNFRVKRNGVQIADVNGAGGVQSYSDATAVPGSTYTYQIELYLGAYGGGTAAHSRSRFVTITVPTITTADPTDLTVGKNITESAVVLNWINNGASGAVTVEYKVDNGIYNAGWSTYGSPPPSSSQSATVGSLLANTRYAFRVKLASSSAYTNVAFATTQPVYKLDSQVALRSQ